MGSGKTSVARALSRRLELPVIDLDAEIETQNGISIAAFFAEHGEDAFRELETAALRESLKHRAVIATGGGVITREPSRALLAGAAKGGARIVYLRASPETLAARIRRQDGTRPLIDGDKVLSLEETTARVRELLQQRAGFYASCATRIVDTDSLSTGEVVQQIAQGL